MKNEKHITALVADIRDCARRAKELCGLNEGAALSAIASNIERAQAEHEGRDSVLPPVLASNQETRATATRHFQKTREILRGIR